MSLRHWQWHYRERTTYPAGSKHREAQWPWALTALILFLIVVALGCEAVR